MKLAWAVKKVHKVFVVIFTKRAENKEPFIQSNWFYTIIGHPKLLVVSKQHFETGFLNQRWHIHGTLHVLQGFFCCNSSMIVLSWKFQSWLFTKKTCPNVPSHVASARTFEETKPAKFVKLHYQLIDPVRWLLVPIMGSWIQVDGCSLHGYDHPLFGLYRPGVTPSGNLIGRRWLKLLWVGRGFHNWLGVLEYLRIFHVSSGGGWNW